VGIAQIWTYLDEHVQELLVETVNYIAGQVVSTGVESYRQGQNTFDPAEAVAEAVDLLPLPPVIGDLAGTLLSPSNAETIVGAIQAIQAHKAQLQAALDAVDPLVPAATGGVPQSANQLFRFPFFDQEFVGYGSDGSPIIENNLSYVYAYSIPQALGPYVAVWNADHTVEIGSYADWYFGSGEYVTTIPPDASFSLTGDGNSIQDGSDLAPYYGSYSGVTSYVDTFDATTFTREVTWADGATSTYQQWSSAADGGQVSNENNYNSSSQLTCTVFTTPGGVVIQHLDTAGDEPWTTYTEVFDVSGNLDSSSWTWDDGTTYLYEFDQDGTRPWIFYERHTDADGNILSQLVKWDDGTSTYERLSGDDTITDEFDASGALLSEHVLHADGSYADYTYDYDSTQAWFAQFSVHTADSTLLRTGTKADDGTVSISSYVDYVLGSDESNLTLLGSARSGTGNDLANVITGNSAANILDGGAGVDRMIGGAGNDVYYVDNYSDKLIENAGDGNDVVFSSANFKLGANVETLRLQGSADLWGYGNGLNNVLIGNAGANKLYGLDGNDVLKAGAGIDKMFGGTGDDIYYVDNYSDGVVENIGEGTDSVFASTNYKLGANVEKLTLQGSADLWGYGNGLDNTLTGNSGANKLYGLAGADILNGGAGSDWLEGGAGQDRLSGGADNDSFVFRDGDFAGLTTSTCDEIKDFATGDKIRLSFVDANTGLAGDQAFSFIGTGAFTNTAGELRYEQISGNTYVEGDTNGDGVADFMIRVDGLHTLTSGDFGL
jgi:Ca2+-binding RTX toxin-like protein